VEDPKQLWTMWRLANQYSSRPSEVMSITNPVLAFYVDRAVSTFGMAVEEDLREQVGKQKSDLQKQLVYRTRLNSWLQSTTGFRDPLADR
jgi:hypothetical protein